MALLRVVPRCAGCTVRGSDLPRPDLKTIADFVGFVPDEELILIYKSSDLFELPLVIRDQIYVGLTSRRIFKVEGGKCEQTLLEAVVRCTYRSMGWFTWDKVELGLRGGATTTYGIYYASACKLFCSEILTSLVRGPQEEKTPPGEATEAYARIVKEYANVREGGGEPSLTLEANIVEVARSGVKTAQDEGIGAGLPTRAQSETVAAGEAVPVNAAQCEPAGKTVSMGNPRNKAVGAGIPAKAVRGTTVARAARIGAGVPVKAAQREAAKEKGALFHNYVLECEDGMLYVGRVSAVPGEDPTVTVDRRFASHVAGTGAEFTRKHPPMRVLRVVPNQGAFQEDALVLEEMTERGVDKVRGGTYSTEALTPSQLAFIGRQIRGATDRCYKCGLAGHFAKNCRAQVCARCGRASHTAERCYAKTTIEGKALPKMANPGPAWGPRYKKAAMTLDDL